MLPDRVSNPRPLTYGSGALPTALRGPACISRKKKETKAKKRIKVYAINVGYLKSNYFVEFLLVCYNNTSKKYKSYYEHFDAH